MGACTGPVMKRRPQGSRECRDARAEARVTRRRWSLAPGTETGMVWYAKGNEIAIFTNQMGRKFNGGIPVNNETEDRLKRLAEIIRRDRPRLNSYTNYLRNENGKYGGPGFAQ